MIEYAVFTDIGEKEKNEDTVKVFINQPSATIGFVLADGLGGHGNGEIASQFVADCVGAAIENSQEFSGMFIDQCFDTAQELLMDEKERSGYSSIKTTMVLLLITNGKARWGHIGDSRLYCFRGGKVYKKTLDHSVPQMLALSGQIKEKDIRHHPERSTLLRAMGSEWNSPMYEIGERDFQTRKGDVYLLCSDGFWEWIEEKTILRILAADAKKDLGVYDILQEMTEEVFTCGRGQGMDNLSAILVKVK